MEIDSIVQDFCISYYLVRKKRYFFQAKLKGDKNEEL